MPTITTVANVKSALGLTGSEHDVLLGQIVAAVDVLIGRITGREAAPNFNAFERARTTEYYDGTGNSELLLRRRPVTEIVDVWVDPCGAYGQATGVFTEATRWTAGVDYVCRSHEASEHNPGILIALGQPRFWSFWQLPPPTGWHGWPLGQGNIKVDYWAGYATLPADLVWAATTLAGLAFKQRADQPLKSEKIGEYSYEVAEADSILASAAAVQPLAILSGYRDQ